MLAGILPRIYPQMLDEVHRHQDDGRATFIVSAAGNDLVKALAAVLGMEGGIGTRWAIGSDGKYTGEMEGPFVYGEGKVEAMQRFAERHQIDMEASYAYSDSASDLPMLRSVGNAVVVNPDADLLEIAREEGWRVMRFEKLGRKLAIARRHRPRRGGRRRGSAGIEAPQQQRPDAGEAPSALRVVPACPFRQNHLWVSIFLIDSGRPGPRP